MKDIFYTTTGGNISSGMRFGQGGAGTQGKTYYFLFELIYAIPDNLNPIHTEKELTVVLEYPYPIEKYEKYVDIAEYKERTVKMVREYFPNSTIAFSGQDKSKICELFSFVKEQGLLKQKEGGRDELWTYRYAIDFQEVYVVPKNCECLMHVIVPRDMADTLMKYDAWEDFTTQASYHIKMNLGVDFCEIDFPNAEHNGKDHVEHAIHIPLNHVVNEEHRLALDYWKERSRITKEFEPWLFEFIKDNAVTPATRREAKFIQPEDIESGFFFRLEKEAEAYLVIPSDKPHTGRSILDIEPFTKYLYPLATMASMGEVAFIKIMAVGYLFEQLVALSVPAAIISVYYLGIVIVVPTVVITLVGEYMMIQYIKKLLAADFKDSEAVINYINNATSKEDDLELLTHGGGNKKN